MQETIAFQKGPNFWNPSEAVPLLVLDISRVEQMILPSRLKERSRSEEKPQFRLHILFGKKHDIVDFHRKKDWVFHSELNVAPSRYMDMLRMFKDSLTNIEHRPEFVSFSSTTLFSNFKILFLTPRRKAFSFARIMQAAQLSPLQVPVPGLQEEASKTHSSAASP